MIQFAKLHGNGNDFIVIDEYNGLVVPDNSKPGFVAMVTPDLLERGLHAGEIVKQVAGVTGGSGGGKAEVAQAGGKDKNKIDEALGLVKSFVEQIVRA